MNLRKCVHLFVVSALLALCGLFVVSCSFWWSVAQQSTAWWGVCLYGGLFVCGVALVVFLVAFVGYKLNKSKQPKVEKLADVSFKSVQTEGGKAVFVAEQSAGTQPVSTKQTDEQKMEQISKMDKTQFVVFVAGLFSKKGYQVKLTPVVANNNVDVLLTHLGATIAVGVVHSQTVLSAEQIQPVLLGAPSYNASEVIVVTNNYFDRSAVDFAKRKGVSLVDRTLLLTEFCR